MDSDFGTAPDTVVWFWGHNGFPIKGITHKECRGISGDNVTI